MIYFIGDLHLFCRSQTNEGSVNYDSRPFDTVEELELRIPDKYLIAKGWMEAPQEDTAIVKALVLNHLKAEYQMNDKQAQDAWHYLVQAPDVLAEFKDYIVTGNFAPDDKSLKVEGYSAKALKETTYLSPLGSYNYLIYLRNNPAKALADLKAGLPKR